MHDTLPYSKPPPWRPGEASGMTGPSDLKGMRILTGIGREELGSLLGVGPGEVRDLEKSRTHFVYAGHIGLLSGLLSRVNAELEAVLDRPAPPEFLISFPNDGAFKDYEPDLASWMPFNSVHQMFIYRQLDAWMAEGFKPSIVELVPAQYQEYISARGGRDTEQLRQNWASAHVQVIRTRSGMPGKRGPT